MKSKPIRLHPTIACCGIDCGFCPRFYTKGSSRCPGCGGQNFYEKHPSCGILSCCTIKHQFQSCGECDEFPCSKFNGWDAADSFVSHKNSIQNLTFIKQNGISSYLSTQNQKMAYLDKMLQEFDDGRVVSKYCLAATFFPIFILEQIIQEVEQECLTDNLSNNEIIAKAKKMKEKIEKISQKENINLTLRKRK